MFIIPWLHFRMQANFGAHSTSRYLKTMWEMQQHPQQITKNERVPDSWMDTMFIPYIGTGVIINIVSKEDSIHRITIDDIPQCTCPDFTKMLSWALGRKRKWVYCKHLYYVFMSLQNGLWEPQVHSCSNIPTQPSHAPSWACRCGCTRVVMLISFLYYYPQMYLYDKYIVLSYYELIQLWFQYIIIKYSIWLLVVIGIITHTE